MNCLSCGKPEAILTVLDGPVCDYCYSSVYICCRTCGEMYHRKHIVVHAQQCSCCYEQGLK